MSILGAVSQLNGSIKNTRSPEQTSSQWQGSVSFGRIAGILEPLLPGTFSTYRQMLHHPTIALCRAATKAMLKAPDWSVEADDGVPDEVVGLIEDTFFPNKSKILNDLDYAQYYGFAAFEKVWGMMDGRLTIVENKPLLADVTAPIVDDKGKLIGVENQGIRLGLEKAWLYTHDGEAGDPWGDSLLENMRCTSYRAWHDTFSKCSQYTTKSAGVIPVVQMPVGTSNERDGSEKQNHEMAETLLNHLSTGKGVVWPVNLPEWVQRILAQQPSLAEYLVWQIKFLEVASGHGAEFISLLDYHDKGIARAMLWPERAILEGLHGTKADAGEHGDLVVEMREQRLADMIDSLNRNEVDDILEANWGEQYKGAVRIVPGPLSDAENAYFRQLITQIVQNPTSLEVAFQLLDVDAMLDSVGLPKADEIVVDPNLNPNDSNTLPDNAPPSDPNNPPQDQNQPDAQAIEMARTMQKIYHRARKEK